jgi:hypothetical protein
MANMWRKASSGPRGRFGGVLGREKGRFANKNREKSQKNALDFEDVVLMKKELVELFRFQSV